MQRTFACALVGLAGASCDSTGSPDAYTRLTIEPRELNIAVGLSGPLRLAYFAMTAAGDRESLPPRAVAISARGPFYAEVRNDSIFAHRFGGTYLRAEYRPASGGRLRDSIPIIVFEVR
jgi:hypothetical protein